MIKNHDFKVNDTVICADVAQSIMVTIGKCYLVLEIGFFSIKIINDKGLVQWINATAFHHIPRVTIVRGHLKRIVFGH